MNITRRDFGKHSLLGILIAWTTTSGFICTSSSIFDTILTWIPIGTSAINGIVTVLDNLVPAPALVIITLIMAALNSLGSTITQYKKDTNPADKATLLAKIRTILNDIVTNFQAFLNSLNLGNNPIEAIVVGLAQVVLAALAGFLGQLPPATAKAISYTFHVGKSGKDILYTPKLYKNPNDFIRDYNAIADLHSHSEIDIH